MGEGKDRDAGRRAWSDEEPVEGFLPEKRALSAMWGDALDDATRMSGAELSRSLKAMESAQAASGANGVDPWDSADYASRAAAVARDAATVTRLLAYRGDDRIVLPVAVNITKLGRVVDRSSLASSVLECARMHVADDESTSEIAYYMCMMRAARSAPSVAAESDPGSFKMRRDTGNRTA